MRQRSLGVLKITSEGMGDRRENDSYIRAAGASRIDVDNGPGNRGESQASLFEEQEVLDGHPSRDGSGNSLRRSRYAEQPGSDHA